MSSLPRDIGALTLAFAMGALVVGGDEPAVAAQTPVPKAAATQVWSLSASAYTYLLPDEDDYVQPTFTADRGRLHLEARYQYEARKAGSLWIGYNLGFGDTLALELTPMLGAVFGEAHGIAAGYRASLRWRRFDLTSESEYLFDSRDSADSFLYTWSELGFGPREWLRCGLAVQRTKVYATDFDIQRGFFVGFAHKSASFTTYVFNPDDPKPTVVLGLSLEF